MATGAAAQKKTVLYPDGTKAFEGEYIAGYNTAYTRDLMNFDTATDKRRASMLSMSAGFGMERDLAPQRIYNGKCVFYYPNGKISYSGTYEHGIKNGPFAYFYIGGEKEAEMNYVHGMADGKWTTWHKNGKIRSEQSYIAFTEAEMDTFYSRKMSGGGMYQQDPLMTERNGFRRFTVDSLQKMPGNSFTKFTEAENKFDKHAHWNGDFISYYPNGNKNLEMHYANDRRVGKWYYRDEEGKVKVELAFTEGKISSVVNNMPPEQRPAMPAMMQRPGMPGGGRDSMNRAMPQMPPAQMSKEPTKK
ncbi:hypothetical protein GCM10023093_05570 [Nemorincola caseinilytica]|uniref:Toxin-antitoxin system YwqK family antitoxin n=1 Tax=Nemorincola caseinilytica TaxID=2054315 RepID=A0ABP8N7I9_9BACT